MISKAFYLISIYDLNIDGLESIYLSRNPARAAKGTWQQHNPKLEMMKFSISMSSPQNGSFFTLQQRYARSIVPERKNPEMPKSQLQELIWSKN